MAFMTISLFQCGDRRLKSIPTLKGLTHVNSNTDQDLQIFGLELNKYE